MTNGSRQIRSLVRGLHVPYPLVTLGILILAWEASVVAFDIPRYLLPPFHRVMVALWADIDLLLRHAGTTAFAIFVGFAFTLLVALPMAMAIASWRLVDKLVYPILVGSQTIPKIAIAPLLLVWLGFGIAPKIGIIVVMAFFPLVIYTVTGLKSVPLEMINLGRSMGMGKLAMARKIVFPNALPSIFAGVKVAVTLSVIAAVVGEFVGSDAGLGFLLIRALADLNVERMFASLVVLSTIGIVLFYAVAAIEKATIPWHASVRSDELRAVEAV